MLRWVKLRRVNDARLQAYIFRFWCSATSVEFAKLLMAKTALAAVWPAQYSSDCVVSPAGTHPCSKAFLGDLDCSRGKYLTQLYTIREQLEAAFLQFLRIVVAS